MIEFFLNAMLAQSHDLDLKKQEGVEHFVLLKTCTRGREIHITFTFHCKQRVSEEVGRRVGTPVHEGKTHASKQ